MRKSTALTENIMRCCVPLKTHLFERGFMKGKFQNGKEKEDDAAVFQ